MVLLGDIVIRRKVWFVFGESGGGDGGDIK